MVAEAIKGDEFAAQERLKVIRDIPVLEITDSCVELASLFFNKANLPENARDDALHIAIAANHKMDFLLTWNFRHLANAHFIRKLQRISLDEGLMIPTICTPQEIDNER